MQRKGIPTPLTIAAKPVIQCTRPPAVAISAQGNPDAEQNDSMCAMNTSRREELRGELLEGMDQSNTNALMM